MSSVYHTNNVHHTNIAHGDLDMEQKHLHHHLPRAQAQETNHATTCAPSRALEEGGLLEKREVELWPRMVARELPLWALLHLLDRMPLRKTCLRRTVYASCDHSICLCCHHSICLCLAITQYVFAVCHVHLSLLCLTVPAFRHESMCLPLE